MNILKRIDKALTKAEEIILITLLSVMVVMAFLQVVLRNLFSSGIFWADILLRHLLLWLGFLGAAIATSENRHINIDALRRFFSPRVRSAVEVLTDLFAAGICFLLAKASWTFVQGEIAGRSTVFENIPSWYAQIIIPVGFGLLVVHFVIRAILRAGGAAPEGERL
ncbi:MAG: TRAP transporter small permease [Ignavibacteria bacterium]|jgi:TRAP-type C4-dicarboxylate transport system permease small subunit|nr:TRAP transporter small permease [Ignavibacteria bacterium]